MIYGEDNTLNLNLMIAFGRTLQALHKRSSEIFKSGGLTTSQFAVLEALYHKGSMTVNELTKSVLSTSGNMTVVINNLIKSALVTRSINPEDGRSYLISITEKGSEYIKEIFPNHMKDLQEHFKPLSQEEKEQLIRIMKKIRDANISLYR
ncbi:MarR family winged helix-turn-helix transcriptional regulator [Anaeropeptidivorans aminofermentans]|uniref:MarR family winged helix-turn-helix transcriptional regulator n=1 Tax=Anaeropeptidivorans aminofermentans TaxID=2934315 RepID=UPI002024B220|nr:MarR family transcriptional regulator [Anaeropeptidivorans aminofermentans]